MKIPLGLLLHEKQAGRSQIKQHLSDDSYVITVGDRTTKKMIDFGFTPSLQIIDGLEKRQKREPPKLDGALQITVENPPAQITQQSINAILKALTKNPPVQILVHGEEDLLVLPVCIYAPDNAVVFYGQPNEGLVIVKVTPEIRNKAQELVDLME